MAAQGKSSRWGSFLSQAVAGVESRLDTMLGDADGVPLNRPAQQSPSLHRQQSSQGRGTTTPKPNESRSSSQIRTGANDRLQARLAKAVAGKNSTEGSPKSSFDSTRPSIDKGKDKAESSIEEKADTDKTEQIPNETTLEEEEEASKGDDDATTDGNNEFAIESTTQKTESDAAPTNKDDMATLAKDIQEIKRRQDEEIQEYVERVDSLESKLQYLSQTTAESSKATAVSLPAGSLERKVAERDEKIALLMEEGQKLSSGEQKYRTIIKKLRLQLAETEKQKAELQISKDGAFIETETLKAKLNGNLETSKAREEMNKATASLKKEIDLLKKDKATNEEKIKVLQMDKKQLAETAEKADSLNKLLVAERETSAIKDRDITNLTAEKDVLSENLRQEKLESAEKLERAIQRGKTVESELRIELSTMEAKLEAMRSEAEEVSSGSGGEAQMKLLRQIETLQSQYTSASHNWQGIEASLVSKNSTLESERDEAQKRESEMRKKARDATTRARAMEEELEDIRPILQRAEDALAKQKEEIVSVRAAAKATQQTLEQVRVDLDKEKKAASVKDYGGGGGEPDHQRRWIDEVAGTIGKSQSRPQSPLLAVQRTFSSDFMGLPLPGRPRVGPNAGSLGDGSSEMFFSSRRPSGVPPTRLNSAAFSAGSIPAPYSPFEAPSESAVMSPPPIEEENSMDDAAPSSSPMQAAQDMISMSTVAAGPSVQLVERMSAAIRRLEAEKMAAKEEMLRVCSQRDEARSDMVRLLKEAEEAKVASARVPELEIQVSELDQRYQTTLEMLGEKSELVEELKADVQDVKQMYRELVERTVK